MRRLRSVCFGLAVLGLACMIASAEPPKMLKRTAVPAPPPVQLKEAPPVHAPLLQALPNGGFKVIPGTGSAALRDNNDLNSYAYDNAHLPGSADGWNIFYVNAENYTDPDSNIPGFYIIDMDEDVDCLWVAPTDYMGVPMDILFENWNVNPDDWPNTYGNRYPFEKANWMVGVGGADDIGANIHTTYKLLYYDRIDDPNWEDPNDPLYPRKQGTKIWYLNHWRLGDFQGGFYFPLPTGTYDAASAFRVDSTYTWEYCDQPKLSGAGYFVEDWQRYHWDLDLNGNYITAVDANNNPIQACRKGLFDAGGRETWGTGNPNDPIADPNDFGLPPRNENFPDASTTQLKGWSFSTYYVEAAYDPNVRATWPAWFYPDHWFMFANGYTGGLADPNDPCALDPNSLDPNFDVEDPNDPNDPGRFTVSYTDIFYTGNIDNLAWYSNDNGQIMPGATINSFAVTNACPDAYCDADIASPDKYKSESDCKVGFPDLTAVLLAYGSRPGDVNWYWRADYNCADDPVDDGPYVGFNDLVKVLLDYGRNCQ